MVEPIEQPPLTRAERKERTRRALLEGTLDLLADRNFSGLSLREVARAAEIVPTAFYRHFASLEDLGVAMVEESMRMLRQMLRDARRDSAGAAPRTAKASLEILHRQVRSHSREFRFLTRERHGGTSEIRRAIDTELRLFTTELTVDLARVPALAQWPPDDLEMASSLLVTTVLETVPALLDARTRGPEAEQSVLDHAARQMRLVILGMAAWRPSH